MSSPRTLVVLGGGGALGAFQVGGLLALAEAGLSRMRCSAAQPVR